MRTVYVNGEFVSEDRASVSIFDRGFLFADAVYEVTAVIGGKLLDFAAHMTRLERSLAELDMTMPLSQEALLAVHRKLVELNGLDEGIIYLQVTRGAADRDFLFPRKAECSLVMFTQKKGLLNSALAERGLKVVTVPDMRWGRCDIKTTQLLYSSLVKSRAAREGADDVWLVADGLVTEGSSNNAFIVTREGVVVTRPLSNDILHGITRAAVLTCVAEADMRLEERAFSLDEAMSAAEAFNTSSSAFVNPVVMVDGRPIGKGVPGPFARRLREVYLARARAGARRKKAGLNPASILRRCAPAKAGWSGPWPGRPPDARYNPGRRCYRPPVALPVP